MQKYRVAMIAIVIAVLLILAAFLDRARLRDPHVSTYLEKVYPLAKKKKLNLAFFDSLGFYWYDPVVTASFFKGVTTVITPGSHPSFVCLSWMLPCIPKNSMNGVVRNQYPFGQMTPNLAGTPSNHLIEVYHNGWYQEPGLYFYALKGTGTFLNVGKTLIARNKVDALSKMGLSDSKILQTLSYHIVESIYVPTYDYIAEYADKHEMTFNQALSLLMKESREGTDYAADRFNATASGDYVLYLLARKKGYDTVQFTNQANTNGGWAYEIVDVRANNADSLKERWIKERKYLFIADPFNTEKNKPCELPVPFEMVRCMNKNSSEIRQVFFNG